MSRYIIIVIFVIIMLYIILQTLYFEKAFCYNKVDIMTSLMLANSN